MMNNAKLTRSSIYEEGGKCILATLKPTTLLALFVPPPLKAVAQEVEDTIVKIMQEAAAADWTKPCKLMTVLKTAIAGRSQNQ